MDYGSVDTKWAVEEVERIMDLKKKGHRQWVSVSDRNTLGRKYNYNRNSHICPASTLA
jgi:hypothetical protein